jgi:DNA invertase Pin-like site-specific DNA recombinase
LPARKLSGVKLGRPSGKGKSKLDENTEDIVRLLDLKVPKTIIAKQYNTSVGNLYNFINRLEQST